MQSVGLFRVETEKGLHCWRHVNGQQWWTQLEWAILPSPHLRVTFPFLSTWNVSMRLSPQRLSAVFVSLSQSGLSCWSFSGWLHHCICLLDVPRLPLRWNLVDFKKTKRKSELICSHKLPSSLFASSLFYSLVMSCLLLLSLLSPIICPLFVSSHGSRRMETQRARTADRWSRCTVVEAASVSDSWAVMECDGKLRPNSSEVRQRKPRWASDQLDRWEPMTTHNRSTWAWIKSRTQQSIWFQT